MLIRAFVLCEASVQVVVELVVEINAELVARLCLHGQTCNRMVRAGDEVQATRRGVGLILTAAC